MKTSPHTSALSARSRRAAWLLLLSAALGFPAKPAAAQNLLVNGDFETTPVLGTIPAGWNLIQNSFGTYHGLWNGLFPQSGSWFVHVGNSGGPGGLYQDIATVPGQQYSLSFWGAPWTPLTERGIVQVGTPGPDPLSLSLNNNAEYVNSSFIVSGLGGAPAWSLFSFDFTAASSIARISFQNSYYVTPFDSAVNVDTVSLTPVPEPSSISLSLLVFLMLRRSVPGKFRV